MLRPNGDDGLPDFRRAWTDAIGKPKRPHIRKPWGRRASASLRVTGLVRPEAILEDRLFHLESLNRLDLGRTSLGDAAETGTPRCTIKTKQPYTMISTFGRIFYSARRAKVRAKLHSLGELLLCYSL